MAKSKKLTYIDLDDGYWAVYVGDKLVCDVNSEAPIGGLLEELKEHYGIESEQLFEDDLNYDASEQMLPKTLAGLNELRKSDGQRCLESNGTWS